MILAGAVERSFEIRLCVCSNAVFDFVSVFVNVYPVHNRCLLSDGGDQPFVVGIGIGEIVSRIRMTLSEVLPLT
jgi:hypothetical protein